MHIPQQHRKGKGVERPLSFFETGDSDTIYGGQSLTALVKNGVAIETQFLPTGLYLASGYFLLLVTKSNSLSAR